MTRMSKNRSRFVNFGFDGDCYIEMGVLELLEVDSEIARTI